MAREKNRQKPLPSSVDYFERVIGNHNAVHSLQSLGDNVYQINRTGGRSALKILIADIYVVGFADIIEIQTEHKDLDSILLVGFYNRYTSDAKDQAKEDNIGLFNMREFFGALNFMGDKFISYEPKKRDN